MFHHAGLCAVNPVTKAALPWLKQFTVVSDVAASVSAASVVIYPAMIWSGAFQNIYTAASDLDNSAVSFLGSASTTYAQNLVFHKNAFALAIVPMVSPPGAHDVLRERYAGRRVFA